MYIEYDTKFLYMYNLRVTYMKSFIIISTFWERKYQIMECQAAKSILLSYIREDPF